MQDVERSIFRAAALQRYVESRDEFVPPRFVSPRTLLWLWILLGLLAGVAALTWFAAGAAIARFDQAPPGSAALDLASSISRAEIAVWAERLTSFLPWFGTPLGPDR